MKLFIDTGTWLKLDALNDLHLFDPRRLYDWCTIHVTHQVDEELHHFANKSIVRELTNILPVKNKEVYEEAIDIGFDPADASIVSYGEANNPDKLIISEDRPLLKYFKVSNTFIIQLIDLFQIFTSKEYLSKKELFQLAREMHRLRNISRKKQELVHRWLKDPG